MLEPLDFLLRDLIQSRVPGFIGPTQVGFVPPNADWKAAVIAAAEERFNFYLYDLRENVRLRTNEVQTISNAGVSTVNRPSPRLDCTYLVTAWSPVAPSPLFDPAREEHRLLYQAVAALMQFRPLVPFEVYPTAAPSGLTFAAFQALAPALVEQPLPMQVSLPDAVREPAEFWTTMKVDSRPAIRLTVTIPVVVAEPDAMFPDVLTVLARHNSIGAPGRPETVLTIGGRVLRQVGNAPIDGAWVQMVGTAPPAITAIRKQAVTEADGRFIFSKLPQGKYQLRVVAEGVDKLIPAFDVPLVPPAGTYDVHIP